MRPTGAVSPIRPAARRTSEREVADNEEFALICACVIAGGTADDDRARVLVALGERALDAANF